MAAAAKDRKETAVRYWHEAAALTLEAAQMQLRYGVTTVRDSYGALHALIASPRRHASGEAIGPRMLVAGNIVGWGGPVFGVVRLIGGARSVAVRGAVHRLHHAGHGRGADVDMYPDELRVAINKYLDKGPDFIKYGGTSHWMFPTFIGFSPEAQKSIVEETHKRGLMAETHATNPEGLRLVARSGHRFDSAS